MKGHRVLRESSVLSYEFAEVCRDLSLAGNAQASIAEEYKLSQSYISRCLACLSEEFRYDHDHNQRPWPEAYDRVVGRDKSQLITQSKNSEWYTPALYVEAVRSVLGGIDLDPASCEIANKVVQAETYYTKAQDGLSHPWTGRVFLNPPYQRKAGDFIQRLCDSHSTGLVSSAIALVNSNCTDTAWFQPLFDYPLCFVQGRVDFDTDGRDEDSGPTHGTLFAYLGADVKRFVDRFEAFGPVMSRCRL
jgi:hypothetical protein